MENYFSHASLSLLPQSWKYVVDASMSSSSVPKPNEHVTAKPSFANVVASSAPSTEIPSNRQPSVKINKGGFISIKVDEEIYSFRIASCKNSLIGRLILAKGEALWPKITIDFYLECKTALKIGLSRIRNLFDSAAIQEW